MGTPCSMYEKGSVMGVVSLGFLRACCPQISVAPWVWIFRLGTGPDSHVGARFLQPDEHFDRLVGELSGVIIANLAVLSHQNLLRVVRPSFDSYVREGSSASVFQLTKDPLMLHP